MRHRLTSKILGRLQTWVSLSCCTFPQRYEGQLEKPNSPDHQETPELLPFPGAHHVPSGCALHTTIWWRGSSKNLCRREGLFTRPSYKQLLSEANVWKASLCRPQPEDAPKRNNNMCLKSQNRNKYGRPGSADSFHRTEGLWGGTPCRPPSVVPFRAASCLANCCYLGNPRQPKREELPHCALNRKWVIRRYVHYNFPWTP